MWMTLSLREPYNYPNVSIIILTYNGSEYIAPLLNSLLDQSYPIDRIEIIVVDNASTDKTLDIIKENYPVVRMVPLGKNIGYAAGNNEGVLHARYDFLVFLNQDIVCHPDFLKSLLNVMVADRTIAACNPNIVPSKSENLATIDRKSPLES